MPQAFIGKEKESFIFPDRPSDVAPKLAVIVVHSNFVVGIPVGILIVEETRTMQAVRAAFGDNFHLRSRAATILGGIGVRNNRDFLHRILIGRDDRSTSVPEAVDADAVDGEVVRSRTLAVGNDLNLVFNLENRLH